MSGPDKREEDKPIVEIETVEDLEAASTDEAVLGGAMPSINRYDC